MTLPQPNKSCEVGSIDSGMPVDGDTASDVSFSIEQFPKPELSGFSDVGSQPFSSQGSDFSQEAGLSASQRKKRKPKVPKRDKPAGAVFDLTNSSLSGQYRPDTFEELFKSQHADLSVLYHALKESRRIVVIVGAGISVYAGIPDFRSKLGLFTTLKENLNLKTTGKSMFDANVYQDQTSRSNFYTTVKDLHELCSKSSPTPFHYLLSSIAQDQRLTRLYTQNIDCLDTRLPGMATKIPLAKPWPKTVQLHGTIEQIYCSKCRYVAAMNPELFDSINGSIPDCPECAELDSVREVAGKRTHGVGKIRPKIVLYNEPNPDSEAIGAVTEADLSSRPDCLLVVGTTLKIPGVKRMVKELAQSVHAANGVNVWMNIDDPPPVLSTQFEDCFDLLVKGDCQIISQLLMDYEQKTAAVAQEKARLREERKRKADLRAQEKLRKQLQQSQLAFELGKPTPDVPAIKKAKIVAEGGLLTPCSKPSR